MNRKFYWGLAGLAGFEILQVYFIMPMPGSQRIDSLGVAYFLHACRWVFRIGFAAVAATGCRAASLTRRKWLPGIAALAAASVVWLFNFQMTAEKIFLQPAQLTLKSRGDSSVSTAVLIVGIARGGEAKAYPIRYLVYHHLVQDTLGGKPVIVTYCSVCRTARVFEPEVDGRLEKFRLVGMDHFNAMFEDAITHSWWRQATGEAVVGPRKGARLPEIDSSQVTLREWYALHPDSLVMQPDEASKENYDTDGRFERGKSQGELTRTDRRSWLDKSWIVGVQAGPVSKAYDWNRLKAQRAINDVVGSVPIVVVLTADQNSFAVFERPDPDASFSIKGDVITGGGRSFDLAGRDLAAPDQRLKFVNSHQEFWHSWRTFHPGTLRDSP